VGSLYYNPNTGKQVESRDVVREEKAAARTKKARQKPVIKRRKAIARGVAPAVARAQTPLVAPPGTTGRAPQARRPQVNPRDAFLAEFNKAAGIRPGGPKQPEREVSAGGLDRLQLLKGNGGGLASRIVGNFGGDILDVVTGLPSAAQLGAENFAAFNPVVGPLRFVPGLDAVDRYQDRVAGLDKRAAVATKDDYTYRYGPAFSGDWDEFGERVVEHPGFTLLDATAIYSAGGSAVRLAAKGGALATGSGRLAATGSRAITPGSARYRTPKTRTVQMGENSPATASISVPRRPMSANPITRSVQRGAGKARASLARRVERHVDDNENSILKAFGREAKFNRTASTAARDYRLGADMDAHKALRMATTEYANAVKALDKTGISDLVTKGGRFTHEQVDAALWAHAKDLLDVPGKTPRQALTDVVAKMREGQSEFPRRRTKGANKTIETLESLPDELIDLKNGSKQLQAAVTEYRKVSELATDKRVAVGTISPETARDVKTRAAQSIHEGVEYDQKTGLWSSPRNPYTNVGKKGVYVQDVPADPLKKGRAGDPSGAYGRMTQDKVRQSHGTLLRAGNVRTDRGLPIKALERALVDENHPKFVEDFYKTFAFRESNAKLSTGQRATKAMEADPDNVVLMSRKSLDDAMRLNRELPEGELPDSPLRGVEIYEGREGLARVKELGDRADDLVAFPKAAVEGMREGWNKIKGGQIPVFDTAQTLWKRGILAYAPRYYLNSLVGNTAQFGMLTGFDLRSLSQARWKKMGNVVPERVSGSTNVAESRIGDARWDSLTVPGKKLAKFSDRLMEWQASFDALFRRAAYLNRMKRGLRDEGVKIRGMSAEDFGEAIRTAPKEVKAHALRETELFLGDYLRLSPIERATLRRIFPFYSFMRFIGRFMLEMPVRHPKRAAVIALVGRASAEAINDLDQYQGNLANRGRLMYGGLAQRTTGFNTMFPYADLIRAGTTGDVQGAAGALADSTSPIGLQQFLRNYSATGAFGVPVSAPPGYKESFQSYGGPMMRIDPATGRPGYYNPTVPLSEQFLQTVPLLPQIARGVLSAGERPYDTTTTLGLLNYRLNNTGTKENLFKPRRKNDPAMEPFPVVGPILGWAGMNIQNYDRDADIKAIKLSDRLAKEAKKQTASRKRKASRG
jgi:hypothetical protein